MPAFCTHHLFMTEMLDTINNELNFKINEKVAAIGAQGPDVFFFHRVFPVVMPGKSERKVGNQLHNSKPEDIFDAFKEYLEICENKDIAKSYIYGFILHYALDRTCHPYVYAFVDKYVAENSKLNNSTVHNQIEIGMDTYLLHKKLGIEDASTYEPEKVIDATQEERIEISKAISFIIKRVCDKDIAPETCKQAIDDMVDLEHKLRNQKGMTKAIALSIEVPLAPVLKNFKFSSMIKPKEWKKCEKYANIEKNEWRSPYQIEITRNESFEELYDFAKRDGKMLLEGFEKMLLGDEDAKHLTKNISFLTGCEVQ